MRTSPGGFIDHISGFEVSYGGPDAPFTTMRAGQSVVNLREAATSGGRASRALAWVTGGESLQLER